VMHFYLIRWGFREETILRVAVKGLIIQRM